MSKDDLDKLFEQFPDMKSQIIEECKIKKEQHMKEKVKAEKRTPLYGRLKQAAAGANFFQ